MNDLALPHATLQAIIDAVESGLILLDSEGRVLRWNRWLARYSGIPAKDAEQRLLVEVFPETLRTRLTLAVQQACVNGLPSLLSPALHGTLMPLYRSTDDRAQHLRMQQLTHVIPVRHDSHAACLIQITDVTANISRERQLRQQTDLLRRAATLDPVTGLSNRKSFDEIFEREFRHAIQSGQTIGLMMIDVEHLHGISELFGREEGDRVLRTLAQAVQAGIRPAQDTAARFATDKIVVLLPARNAEAMCTPGCDILAAAQQIRMPSGQAIAIHCGIAAIRPTPDADAHILISSAEVALFHATHEATGRVVCFDADEGDFIDCPCEGCSQRCGCDHA